MKGRVNRLAAARPSRLRDIENEQAKMGLGALRSRRSTVESTEESVHSRLQPRGRLSPDAAVPSDKRTLLVLHLSCARLSLPPPLPPSLICPTVLLLFTSA